MKTIESALAMLTDISIVKDLKRVLREKDREFLLSKYITLLFTINTPKVKMKSEYLQR